VVETERRMIEVVMKSRVERYALRAGREIRTCKGARPED